MKKKDIVIGRRYEYWIDDPKEDPKVGQVESLKPDGGVVFAYRGQYLKAPIFVTVDRSHLTKRIK